MGKVKVKMAAIITIKAMLIPSHRSDFANFVSFITRSIPTRVFLKRTNSLQHKETKYSLLGVVRKWGSTNVETRLYHETVSVTEANSKITEGGRESGRMLPQPRTPEIFSSAAPSRLSVIWRDRACPQRAEGIGLLILQVLKFRCTHVPPHPPLRRRLRTLQSLRPIHSPPRSQCALPFR